MHDYELDGDDFTEADMLDMIRRAVDNRPPEDTVKRKGVDRETILKFNEEALQTVTVSDPPRIEFDDDGPKPIGAREVGDYMIGRLIIARADLEAAGLTEADVPNLHIDGTGESL